MIADLLRIFLRAVETTLRQCSSGAPAVLPARAPPQAELGFEPADRSAAQKPWPEIDQTGGQDGWD
jgi:hypothetical protein